MLAVIARNWWVVVMRGVLAILFGVLAWTWPGVTMGALVLIWGAYCFADGVLAIVSALSGASGRPWWVLALEGAIGLGAAGVAFLYPGLTAVMLVYLIAAWAIATGILEIAAAIRLRAEIKGEFWLALAGLASVAFGLLLIAQPGVGVLAVAWMVGGYAFVFGVMLVALGFQLRKLKGLGDRVAQVAGAHR